MFFPRLRRQAKWMFVFLALAFGVGFVAFGVGGNLPGTGVADIFRGNAAADGQISASEARDRIEDNPNNATAYEQLANALMTEGKTEEAIPPLERYTRMRPRDTDALGQLAGLYLTRATQLQREVVAAQLALGEATAGSLFEPGLQANGQELAQDRISEARTAEANERYTNAYTRMQTEFGKAVRAYKRLARATPQDPTVQLQLAQAAESGGDAQTALSAYKRFLKLSPDDSSAAIVRQRIQLLQQQAANPVSVTPTAS